MTPPATDRRPATVARLHGLRRRGALSWGALWLGVAMVAPPRSTEAWRQWLFTVTLSLGVLCVAGGSAYYLVVNWEVIGRFGQIGGIFALFTVATVAALRLGVEGLGGKLAAATAAGLIGPLLLVLVTVYPSDGHLWTVFLLWFALMTPFVVAVRWSPLTIGWVVVLDLAVLGGVEPLEDLVPSTVVGLAAAAVNAAVLLVWEARTVPDAPRWPQRVLGVSAWGFLVAAALPTVFWKVDWPGLFALPALVVGAALAQVAWWKGGRDLLLAGAPFLALLVVLASAGARVLVEYVDAQWPVLFGTPVLVAALLVLSVGSLAWLRLGLRGHEEEAS